MNIPLTHFRLDLSADHCTVLSMDVAGRSVNVFWEPVFDDLERVLDEVGRSISNVRPLVVRSAKPNGFAAGADLKRIAAIKSDNEVKEFLERGQILFNRLSKLPMPTVAVIEGVCLGGGLEFAMSCRYRFVAETPRIQIGMPETKLGLIPGWGGTQRLVRLVGIENGIAMLVRGNALDAQSAVAIGLADGSAPPDKLVQALEAFLVEIASAPLRNFELQSPKIGDMDANLSQVAVVVSTLGELSVSQQAVVNAVTQGLTISFQSGLDAERNPFFALLSSEEVRASLDRFINRTAKA